MLLKLLFVEVCVVEAVVCRGLCCIVFLLYLYCIVVWGVEAFGGLECF